MVSTPEARRRRNPNRSIRLLDGGRELVIALNAKDITHYALDAVAADFGKGFRLTKLCIVDGKPVEGETYHVNLDTAGSRHTCECKGFLRHGGCKHVDALSHLLGNNLLAA